jgi:dephospho-CoA kinase
MAGLVSDKLQGLQATGTPVAVVEAAVLFEAGWDYLVEEVWTTDSPVDTVVGRLQARSGLGADEARKRIAAQMSSEERAARAAVVITNAGDLANLESTVRELWERRVEGRIERT